MSLSALDRCIYWQKHVIKASKNPAQIARCRAALAKLEAECDQLLKAKNDNMDAI